MSSYKCCVFWPASKFWIKFYRPLSVNPVPQKSQTLIIKTSNKQTKRKDYSFTLLAKSACFFNVLHTEKGSYLLKNSAKNWLFKFTPKGQSKVLFTKNMFSLLETCFYIQKAVLYPKICISISVWSVQHPNAGQSIQQIKYPWDEWWTFK